VEYYRRKGTLATLNGELAVEQVTAGTLDLIAKKAAGK
jgi:hypothetical protein